MKKTTSLTEEMLAGKKIIWRCAGRIVHGGVDRSDTIYKYHNSVRCVYDVTELLVQFIN